MTCSRELARVTRPALGLLSWLLLAVAGCTGEPERVSTLPLGPAMTPHVGTALGDPPKLIVKWGSSGINDGEFFGVRGITQDGHGDVYVTDHGNHRIQKFTKTGVFLKKWGTRGTIKGAFNRPFGITVDDAGYVYVTDRFNNRVQKFTIDGEFVLTWGKQGYDEGELFWPCGIGFDRHSGYIYVADMANHRIQRFTVDGAFVSQFGGYGVGDGRLAAPGGIAFDADGYIYVAEIFNDRVQVLTPEGGYVRKWGAYGTGPGQFDEPQGIAVDQHGDVYVADTRNHRIQKFTSQGVLLATWGERGLGDGQFFEPYDVTPEGPANLFVVDTRNNRIQKFGHPVHAPFDVKPRTCPDALRITSGGGSTDDGRTPSRGLIDVAVLGTGELDVREIDMTTLRLQGVAPLDRFRFADISSPRAGGSDCDCVVGSPDGFEDLRIVFDKRELAEAVGPNLRAGLRTVPLTGELYDGTIVDGSECLLILTELTLNGECRGAISGNALRGIEVEVSDGQLTYLLETNGAGKFHQKVLGKEIEIAFRFDGASPGYFDTVDRLDVHGDLSPHYVLIPYRRSEVTPSVSLLRLFKTATLTDGTAGNTVLRKWPTRPVPVYIAPFVNAEGLDYADAARRAATRWMERTGLELFQLVDESPGWGVELAYKTREQMGALIAITRHTQDEEGLPLRDMIEFAKDLTSEDVLYRVMLHEFGHTIRLGHLPRGFLMFAGQPLPGDITDDEVWLVKLYEGLPNRIDMSMYLDSYSQTMRTPTQ